MFKIIFLQIAAWVVAIVVILIGMVVETAYMAVPVGIALFIGSFIVCQLKLTEIRRKNWRKINKFFKGV